MKARELLKHIRKEYIFEMYTQTVDNPKGYDQLSRYKMYDEIVKFYDNCSREEFLSYIGKSELKILKSMLAGKFQNKMYYSEFLSVLSNKGFLFLSGINQFEIPEELTEILKRNLGKKLSEESSVRMDVEEVIHGVLRTHGIFPAKLIAQVVSDLMEEADILEVYDMIMDSNNLRFYAFVYEELENDIVIAYNQYTEWYESDIEVIIEGQYHDFQYTHYRTKEEYIAMAEYGYNAHNPKVKKFFDKMENDSENPILWYLYRRLVLAPHFNISILSEPFFTQLIDESNLKGVDYSQVEEVQKNMFSAALVGNTWNEYYANEDIKRREESRVFSYEEVEEFFDVYMALLQYTNDLYEINDDVYSIVDREFDSVESLIDIREHLFNHKHIIDDFVSENPFDFPDDYLQVAEDFKMGILDSFIVCEVGMDYALLMDRKENIYKIAGLHSDMRTVLVEKPPYWLNTLLLPFKGRIIYDGIVAVLDIEMKNNEKKLLLNAVDDEEEYITTFTRLFS